VKRILIYGMGKSETMTVAQARKLVEDLSKTLIELQEVSPWVVLPARVSKKILEELEKSRTSADPLRHAKISAG
jgi:hypothetical protein